LIRAIVVPASNETSVSTAAVLSDCSAVWLPASLEQLDLLLLTVARPRRVQRVEVPLVGERWISG